jgi:regulator of cell morphogenesis and NO signaling
MNHALYSGNIKMADLVLHNTKLLSVLQCFGIELGFGEKTIEEVCTEYGVSTTLFLVVCNQYTFCDYTPGNSELKHIPIEDLVKYLRTTHVHYSESVMPVMLDNLLAIAERHAEPSHFEMVVAFCEKYRHDSISHIQYEEEVLFSYIRDLLAGEKTKYRISDFDNMHGNLGTTLRDLMNIIIKFAPHTCSINECSPVLLDLEVFEYHFNRHGRLEETVLLPLVEQLTDEGHGAYDGVELSERERQTLAALAQGLSNKEIADKLHISTHTVVSHRKNIIRKTGIRTAQGLTLYAFMNELITLKDLR